MLSQQDKGVSVEDVEKITKGVVEQVERERPEAASIGIAATSQASSSATAQGPGSTT